MRPATADYIRISPNRVGRISFYSKATHRFFTVQSRGISDSQVADQIFTNGEYRLPIASETFTAQFQSIIDRGKTPLIIDCGAHIGLASRYFAEQYPTFRVVGLEPSSNNFALAQRHCAEFANIELFKAGIGSRPGFARITNPNDEPWAIQTERVSGQTEIELLSVPEILASRPECELAIVKIDIEGFESDLFAENIDWIDQCPLIIIELHDWALPGTANSKNFIKAIGGRNRDLLQRGENLFSLRNLS